MQYIIKYKIINYMNINKNSLLMIKLLIYIHIYYYFCKIINNKYLNIF